MKMIKRWWGACLKLFGEVGHLERAKRELEEARTSLLAEQSRLEYSQSMVGYHEARIKRLLKYVEAAQNAK